MSTFLSGVAVLLSSLALVCGGYAAYEVFALRQTLNTINNNIGSNTAPAPTSTEKSISSEPIASPSPDQTTSATATTSSIQPGQFVQPAFGTKAEVELLSAKRIKDPESGNRDVVNVQMRIRRKATDRVSGSDIISIASTTARNPETSETYKGVAADRSTGGVALYPLRPNASADAYIWVRVPDGVKNLDIFVPDTAAFKNVPISN
ncbi:hypothetical protein FNW02_18940 [Komarekiella sp. 'clone 1']|uniref:Uncharacterized protein n=1 Tax=Komarekiella delphini-convector SJRDD-AB1 TaxID=2593771 RepID=A0AA40VS69_9NOST|nr:hypothetical protein [Komarekiella delphini-convector SJRDD-AB1]